MYLRYVLKRFGAIPKVTRHPSESTGLLQPDNSYFLESSQRQSSTPFILVKPGSLFMRIASEPSLTKASISGFTSRTA